MESNEKAAPADIQGKVCSSRKISYERPSTSAIKDVWIGEFFNELAVLSQLIEHDYNIVSFDTEFPGIIIDGSTYVKGKRQ